MKHIYLNFLLVFFLPFMASGQQRGDLIRDSLLFAYDRAGIQDVYADFGIPEIFFPIEYDEIELYRIEYWTLAVHGDSLVPASGLVSLPVNSTCDFPLYNYNHGRLTYQETLSEFKAPGMQHLIGVPFAAQGYVGALPDYLGYGATPKNIPHAYTHAKSEATAVVDMLRASRQLCDQYGVLLNGQVFLSGYSHGGHVTMAAHREIEAMHPDEFEITASAPASGPYDLSGIMRDSMLLSDYFSNPWYIAAGAVSYQYVYGNLYDDLSQFFLPPYDSLIALIHNRYDPHSNLEDSLPMPGYQMMQPEYLDNVLLDDEHPMNEALRDNDVYDWAPQAPMRMYYCEADERIPYNNALFAFDTMTALGAPNLTIESAGAQYGHDACAPPALIRAKLWFDTYKKPCSPVATLDVDNLSKEVRVYPNPASQYVQVYVEGQAVNEAFQWELRNMLGQVAASGESISGLGIDLHSIIPGSYLLSVDNGKIKYRERLIVSR